MAAQTWYALVIGRGDLPCTVYVQPGKEAALGVARIWYENVLYDQHDADKDLSAYPHPDTATIEELNDWWADGEYGYFVQIVPVSENRREANRVDRAWWPGTEISV